MPSKRVTIFEGPDCGGKSTAAREYARQTGARYLHLGPFPRLGHRALPRLYADAIMPAVLGYQDVVLDRSWLSEPIYGRALREGKNRVGSANQRILERLMLRCQAAVVLCLPPWDDVRRVFVSRQKDELLQGEAMIRSVYQDYTTLAKQTHLPVTVHDYTHVDLDHTMALVDASRSYEHHGSDSAGAWEANLWLVGESFTEHTNDSNLFRWPFSNFSNDGCSRWLAEQLVTGDCVSERRLGWINSDRITTSVASHLAGSNRIVIALGDAADRRLTKLLVPHTSVPHPQAWKRFHHHELYPLLARLAKKENA